MRPYRFIFVHFMGKKCGSFSEPHFQSAKSHIAPDDEVYCPLERSDLGAVNALCGAASEAAWGRD